MDHRGCQSEPLNGPAANAGRIASYLASHNKSHLAHGDDLAVVERFAQSRGFWARSARFARRFRSRVLGSPRARAFVYGAMSLSLLGLAVLNAAPLANAGQWLLVQADRALSGAGVAITRVTVNGEERIPQSHVLDVLAADDARSLLFFDVEKARTRLLSLPQIKDVSVRKAFPNTLIFEYTERRAYALWQRDGRFAVIDAMGRVIDKNAAPFAEALADAPVFVGKWANEGAYDLNAALDAFPVVQPKIGAAVRVSRRRWTLHTRDAVRIELPEGDPMPALETLASLQSRYDILSRAVTVIDLRLPDRVTLKLSEDALESSPLNMEANT